MIKKMLKIEKGSSKPNTNKIGNITMEQIKEIAIKKISYSNCFNVDHLCNSIIGTARSMGLEVVQ